MKIVVAIKPVPDPTIPVHLRLDGREIDLDGIPTVVNPFDEVALEAALRLRESGWGAGTDILAVSIAPALEGEAILRTALAMGADRALLVTTDVSQTLEPLLVARALHAVCQQQQPDLVIMGKQAPDSDDGQTGPMLAGLLGWNQATAVAAVTVPSSPDEALSVTCSVDGGLLTMALPCPAVMTVDLHLNQPRYASLPNILRTRRMPIEQLDINSLAIDLSPHTSLAGYRRPKLRSTAPGQRLNSATELAEMLVARRILP
ncbi:MAG: electron transfer flavoprotein subunit beta/FixA family protein [Magnetococcales bacterium]|nr:electron transfer flavoprotein subunit beta/FixA family protein [Magnetococcales bacterium]